MGYKIDDRERIVNASDEVVADFSTYKHLDARTTNDQLDGIRLGLAGALCEILNIIELAHDSLGDRAPTQTPAQALTARPSPR